MRLTVAALGRLGKKLGQHSRALEGMYVAIQGFGVVASLIIARSLGPSGRGSMTILVVWAQLLGWISAFSLDKAIVVQSRSSDNSRIDPDDALSWSRRAILTLSLPVSGASVAIGYSLFHRWDWAVMLAIGACATAYGEVGAGWLLAKKKMAQFISYRLGQPTAYILGCSAVALLFRGSPGPSRVDAMAIAIVISLVLPVIVVSAATVRRNRQPIVWRKLVRFAASAQVANAMQYLNARLDILALSLLTTPREVGIYSIGLAAGQSTVLIGSAGIIRGIIGSSLKLDRAGVVGTALFGIVIFALSPFVIPFVFGSAFNGSIRVAQIIALGGAVNFALQSSSGRLLGAGRPWLMAAEEGLGTVVFAIGISISRNLDVVALADVGSYLASFLLAQVFLSRIKGEFQFTGELPVVPE
jgi:O-antigen/teichoic acid export membrane protein